MLYPYRMPSRVVTSILLSLSTAILPAQATAPSQPELYEAHHWFALRAAVRTGTNPFYKAVSEAALHEDVKAREDLNRYIASEPASTMVVDAHEALIGMDFRSARYQDALLEARQILALKPDARDVLNFLPTLEVLAPFVRQTSAIQRTSTLKVQIVDQNLILPVSIKGQRAHYIFDNGFSLSGMSESEAKRLGLSVRSVSTQIDSMSGAMVGTRIAVVPDLAVGDAHFKNVAFYVLPDDQPPFNQLAPGHRGILGLQVVIALKHFKWEPALGTFTIFSGSSKRLASQANLAFDGSSVYTQMSFQGRALDVSLDSGAQTTVLYRNFAQHFPELREGRTEDPHRVTGVGGSASLRSFTLPYLRFLLGGCDVLLKPATVLLEENNSTSNWFEGNLGMDLLNQAQSVEIDFGAMTITLH